MKLYYKGSTRKFNYWQVFCENISLETGAKKCRSLICCLTSVDSDIIWVLCETCNTLCECFTPLEELF